MKKTFKKALSLVLSLALTVMCLSCAFVSASAETTTTPEKMLKITPQVAGAAVSFRQQNLVPGHTYKLKMLQNGITGVIPRERVNWNYVNTPAVAGREGDYTTYTFTCLGDRTRLLFTTEAAGTSGYMADIKLYDTTSGSEVSIDFTAMTFVYGADTYSNWLVDRTDPQSYSEDILNENIANINFIELLDFDATLFKGPEEPVNLEKMLKITPQVAGDAVSFRQQNLVPGHTYKLKMLQMGITEVIPYTTDFATYTKTPVTVGEEGEYTTYTFDCIYQRNRFLFTTESAGTSGYIADVKLFDVTSNEYVDISFTDMTFVYGADTYSNWLTQRPDVTAYSEDILNADIANINFIELLGFDATLFEGPEEPVNLEKMLKITPQIAGDAVSFRQQNLIPGHTYKLKMLQMGITEVIPYTTDFATYTKTPVTVGEEGEYTTYTFDCIYQRNRFLFTTKSAGISGYIADVKLFDVTNNEYVDISFTDMTFVYGNDTYSNWLTQRPDVTAYSEDIKNADIANINFIELLDFDATVFETPEEPMNLEKMLKITPQIAGDAVAFRQQNLVPGHTYKLKMLQKGITEVIPYTTDFATYTKTPVTVGEEGEYTTYTFDCIYQRNRFLFTTKSAGRSGYIADVKLFDVTNNEYVDISFTDMTFVYENDTYSNWLTQRPDVTAYSEDIKNADIANINFIELLDFDATVFETPEEPEEPINLEKMFEITPEHTGDAISFRQQTLVPGHVYRLKMLQKGITSVQAFSTSADWKIYTNILADAKTEGVYTTYTFTCVYERTRLLFTTEAAGISGYMADIKLFDVTSNEYVEIPFTTMTFEYNNETYSNWQVDRPDVNNYSEIKNEDIANINFIELFDYEEKYFLNLGDYNGDSLIDVRDLVRLKKFTAGFDVTVNEKAFVTDVAGESLELTCSRKLLMGISYAQIKEELSPF